MASITKYSIQLQTNLCISSGCNLQSEVICRHCHEQYCHLCFMCHRKYLIDDMQSISEQMSLNRQQGISEAISFIDKQAKDAHEQAKKLVDDAIDRIIKASQNIYSYIEKRRLAKLNRLQECLEKFDKDAQLLNSKLSRRIFLSADIILELRRKYAYNMFDTSSSITIKSDCNVIQHKNERFFENYHYYNELINLRQKWVFLQPALTTVYFPAKKDISLDKILTFLEYRHDRVLENYRDYLSMNEKSKDLSLKSTDELLNELNFLSKKELPKEIYNFTYINEMSIEKTNEVIIGSDLIKTDSGHCDDETSSNSSHNWQIEDGDDYEKKSHKLGESMKISEKQFEQDFQPFITTEQQEEF
ncbi:unnamed protein product [Rotaria sordida]|uniref:Uncharacterized protein n=2 Tax=Rotaria sordida TaxID=392033 RepID=A0A815CI64_9BILA|nr:unnamed protein product [Rotaria sordida]CAF1284558.1 unnamed protein product [Rotaria sordida]CAF3636437.1 unnamed protein product [Rotaria sordida]CAF3714284.1 unnamed protein product [Rotaria sordida]